MHVRDIMSADPACCAPDTRLDEVARMMVEHNCGQIPVIDETHRGTLVGVLTDRDIVARVVATGRHPAELTAGECMSSPVISVQPETSLDECCHLMEQHRIRRVPVVDANGRCCGIVAQADIARHAEEQDTAELLREISR